MKMLEYFDCSQVPEKTATNGNMNEVMVLGHCLLNPLARIKGAKPPLPVDTKGANVIQLPCPESMFFGMRRREITKDQLDHPAYRRFCQEIFTPFADLLEPTRQAEISYAVFCLKKK